MKKRSTSNYRSHIESCKKQRSYTYLQQWLSFGIRIDIFMMHSITACQNSDKTGPFLRVGRCVRGLVTKYSFENWRENGRGNNNGCCVPIITIYDRCFGFHVR